MQLLGLIALSDPAREDSAALVSELKALGVRTVMVTGDAAATAMIVAHAVGLDGALCPPGPIPGDVRPETFAVFAGVLPEDKYKLVKAFQRSGHTVGMCGDGANDAPALRQAQIGIAVSTATDVAKSAAGVVLTDPGLTGIVASVKEGRITFQRIFTYALNSLTKKVVQVMFLGVGLIMTGHAILTPMLMVIVMITGDFLGMSLTTDNVRPSPLPNRWKIGNLTAASGWGWASRHYRPWRSSRWCAEIRPPPTPCAPVGEFGQHLVPAVGSFYLLSPICSSLRHWRPAAG
jgi:H+-transporting ATPase